MLEYTQAQELSQQILKSCGKEPAELVLIHKEHSLTRFANNSIHQNVAEQNLTIYLRLLLGKRQGMASTNRIEPKALDELVSRARANAAASPEDPDFLGLAEPSKYSVIDAFDQPTATYSPDLRAEQVGIVCSLAHNKGLNASGAFSTGVNGISIANSQGLFAYHVITEADFQSVVMSDDSSGRAQASGWKSAEINAEAVGHEAIHKAEQGRNPKHVEPGEYTVILDPYVTYDLLDNLNQNGMGGRAVLDGRSWMNDRLGEQVMSPQVSIWDDGLDPKGMPLPFDTEGIPKQKVDIVIQGVASSPVYDRYTADKAGTNSTGHAIPPYFPAFMHTIGPIALNLFMAPGEASLEDMIRSTKKGLYITRFWYTRLVHPRDCIVTGMTRDGVFMVENGEIAYPVKNLRFTQSYVGALANVETIGSDTRLLKSEYGNYAKCVPALKLNGFNFTGVTV
jgi:predicted Zn-dependent protease